MNVNSEYEDDYYETSDFDIINFDEEFNDSVPRSNPINLPQNKKTLGKKKRRLEDWLEEKRLRDELRDDALEP